MRTLGLYKDNDSKDIPLSTEDVAENIIEENNSTEVIQRMPTYNVDKLNLDILQKEHQ